MTCTICGDKHCLRHVGPNGYCKAHLEQAWEEARHTSLKSTISYAESHSAIEEAVRMSDRRYKNGLRA